MLKKCQKVVLGAVAAVTLGACATHNGVFKLDVGDLRTEAEVVNKFVETICANPLIQTNLTPEAQEKLRALESKVQNTLTAMESVSEQTVTIETGKNWDNYLVSDLSQVLGLLAPITAKLDPNLNHYIQLGYAVIEILQTMTINNPTPQTQTSKPSTISTIALPTVDRDKVNLEVWAGPQS